MKQLHELYSVTLSNGITLQPATWAAANRAAHPAIKSESSKAV
jgi:hypothetical protein